MFVPNPAHPLLDSIGRLFQAEAGLTSPADGQYDAEDGRQDH